MTTSNATDQNSGTAQDRIRVLLVEDNPGDTKLIQRYFAELSETPFDLICTHTLREALELLEQDHITEILLDLSLPDSTGFATFETVYANAQDIPIIILSGTDNDRTITQTLRNGAQDYLIKGNISTTSLRRALRYSIERKRLETELRKTADFNALLLDSLPYPAMLINADHIILATNRIARESGAKPGNHCWRDFGTTMFSSPDIAPAKTEKFPCSFGKQCTVCHAQKALATGEPQRDPEVRSHGRVWDTYWIPLENDTFLHYAIDITENKQAEQIIKQSLVEKETLLKEIHHRVKNNLQMVSSLLVLQSTTTDDPTIHKILENCQDRLKSMALIHEMLYQSHDFTTIGFGMYLRRLAQTLARSYVAEDSDINLIFDIEDIDLPEDKAVQCGLIMNELIANSLEHAFSDIKKGVITISLHKLNTGKIELIVSDNGVGLPADFDVNTTDSLGLHLVSIITNKQLNGTLETATDHGSTFRIQFRTDA